MFPTLRRSPRFASRATVIRAPAPSPAPAPAAAPPAAPAAAPSPAPDCTVYHGVRLTSLYMRSQSLEPTRYSLRLAEKQQSAQLSAVPSAPPSKEFFRRRLSYRLLRKRIHKYFTPFIQFTHVSTHPKFLTMISLPEVKAITIKINMMFETMDYAQDYVMRVKVFMNLYEMLLSDPAAHCILAAQPTFRMVSCMKIAEFCEYLPYNTTLRKQHERLLDLIYGPLKSHPLYIP